MSDVFRYDAAEADGPHRRAADELVSIVDKVSATSTSEVQNLIDDLKALQQKMEHEGNRIRQRIGRVRFAQ